MTNKRSPFLTSAPSVKSTRLSSPPTCAFTATVEYASTFPMAWISIGTDFETAFETKTGAACACCCVTGAALLSEHPASRNIRIKTTSTFFIIEPFDSIDHVSDTQGIIPWQAAERVLPQKTQSLCGFLFFLLNGLRGLVLSALDPLCKCGRVNKRMRIAGFAGFEHQAALQHAAAWVSVVSGPAMDLQVHLHTLYLCDLVGARDGL